MGRTAKYTDEDILNSALALVADDGVHAATAVAIAKRLGAPSGSVYHRFASRDLILATLWIRTVKRFQEGFLEALGCEDSSRAAERAVAHILDWTAANRSEARLLIMYRREDLIALWPEELGEELASLNDGVTKALRNFTTRHFAVANAETLGRARFALIDLPYAAARNMIRGKDPALWLAPALTTASMAVLDGGEVS